MLGVHQAELFGSQPQHTAWSFSIWTATARRSVHNADVNSSATHCNSLCTEICFHCPSLIYICRHTSLPPSPTPHTHTLQLSSKSSISHSEKITSISNEKTYQWMDYMVKLKWYTTVLIYLLGIFFLFASNNAKQINKQPCLRTKNETPQNMQKHAFLGTINN